MTDQTTAIGGAAPAIILGSGALLGLLATGSASIGAFAGLAAFGLAQAAVDARQRFLRRRLLA